MADETVDDRREQCPNRAAHTTGPDGYLQWHEWAPQMPDPTPAQDTIVRLVKLGWTLAVLPTLASDEGNLALIGEHPEVGRKYVVIRVDGSHKFYNRLRKEPTGV